MREQPELFTNGPMESLEGMPRLRFRWIVPPAEGGWTEPPFSVWELERAGWEDKHPHDEINFVLEGELHVESAGKTVVAGPGDTVIVPAGVTGRYWAPVYARMLESYGPNPNGEPSIEGPEGYWEIDSES